MMLAIPQLSQNCEVPQEEIFLKEEPNDSDSSIDVSVPMPE